MVVTKDDDDGGGGEDYDDEIFIKLSPHANQLAQDHLPWSRWSERGIGEKFKRKQTNFEIQFDMGMDVIKILKLNFNEPSLEEIRKNILTFPILAGGDNLAHTM